MPRDQLFQPRQGTAADWTSANPILDEGEPGRETDTGLFKWGDGSTAWNSLPYQNVATSTALETARTINGVSFDGTGNIVVTAAAGTLTGTTINSTVITSSLTSVGTLTSGTWNATKISEVYGGTNQSTYTTGDILYASGSNTLSKLAANSTGTNKYLRSVSSGAPSWQQVAYSDLSGTPTIPAAYQSGEFTAATNGQQFLSYTTPNDATNHTYEVGCWLLITSTALAAVLRMNCSWTLPNGSGVNQDFYGQGPVGGLTTTVATTNAGAICFLSMTVRCKPNTLLQIQFVTASAAVVDGGAWAIPIN